MTRNSFPSIQFAIYCVTRPLPYLRVAHTLLTFTGVVYTSRQIIEILIKSIFYRSKYLDLVIYLIWYNFQWKDWMELDVETTDFGLAIQSSEIWDLQGNKWKYEKNAFEKLNLFFRDLECWNSIFWALWTFCGSRVKYNITICM